MMTRVLIADDDPRITEIHQHYVNKVEGFEVIGLSNTLEDTEMQIRVMEPQLLLLDIYFPDGSGIDLVTLLTELREAHPAFKEEDVEEAGRGRGLGP